MGVIDRLFAGVYDPLTQRAEQGWLGRARRQLLAGARGVCVELGAGTGSNLAHLDVAADLERWIATEPAVAMRRRLHRRLDASRLALDLDIEVVAASAEGLPVADGSVDTVVSTFTLCTVTDLHRTLAEVRRVLRPDGRLLVLEHVGGHGAARRVQRGIEPMWTRVVPGCRLTRDTVDELQYGGFEVAAIGTLDHGPRLAAFPMVTGTARPR